MGDATDMEHDTEGLKRDSTDRKEEVPGGDATDT